MLSITPVRERISERFPIASFVISVPPDRCFEVACATDPRLFSAENRHLRRATNFSTSRTEGLLRAPAGQATYIIPPQQLRRFAGRPRLYYAVAAFRGQRNEDPVLTLSAEHLEHAPSIRIAPDFTGKSLDRGKIGVADARYGGDASQIGWGGDDVLVSRVQARPALGNGGRFVYDDGFDSSLWEEPEEEESENYGRRGTGLGTDGEPFGYEDAPDLVLCGVEPAGYEDAVALPADGGWPADEQLGFEDAPDLERRFGSRRVSADSVPETSAPLLAPASAPSPGAAAASPPVRPAYGNPLRGAALHHERYGSATGAVRAFDAEPARELDGYEDVPDLVRNLGPQHRPRYGNGAAALPAPVDPIAPAPPAVRFPDYSEEIATGVVLPEVAQAPAESDAFTPADARHRLRVIDRVASVESGAERFRAVTADPHAGLLWGYVQFPQRFGGLGHALRVCHRRDRASFVRLFGEHNAAPGTGDVDLEALAPSSLLRVTNAAGEEARMAQVVPPAGGQPAALWMAPWLDVFRAAGDITAFQESQREVADRRLYLPYIDFLRWFGIDSVRGHAMFVDRAIQMGGGAASRWIARVAGPVRSQTDLRQALAHLGHADLRSFQAAPPDGTTIPAADGVFGALTHASLTAALRQRGDSPLPLRSEAEILAALCADAERQSDGARHWRVAAQRLRALKDDPALERIPAEGAR